MERYLRNCWYMAAWADEIGEGGLVREILGQRLFLYRLADGRPAALRDRCPHGASEVDGFNVPQAHILTPANQHESHYFWTASRNHSLDSAEVDGIMLHLFREAFDAEDKPVIEAAYANVRANIEAGGDFWAERPVSLGIDQGGTRARRLLESLIAREAAGG